MNVALLFNRGPLALLRRTQKTRPQQPPTGHTHGGNTHHGLSQQLTAARIRTAVFPRARHGYEPEAVDRLLAQVADEITQLQQRLATTYAENGHIKQALKQWQSDHARTCRNFQSRTAADAWPVNRS